jgi:anti-sigma28 factor (negative regulator of flagellin synthesis)
MDINKVGNQPGPVGSGTPAKTRETPGPSPQLQQAAARGPGTAASGPVPAASVSISPAVAAAAATAASASGSAMADSADTELLVALREQIREGRFEIDYDHLARAIIEDAYSALRAVDGERGGDGQAEA